MRQLSLLVTCLKFVKLPVTLGLGVASDSSRRVRSSAAKADLLAGLSAEGVLGNVRAVAPLVDA